VTDLKAIAKQVFELCLDDKWRPQTRDIQDRFNLNTAQVKKVKKYTRQLALSLRTGWDWDPDGEYFRIVPNNAPEVAKRMGIYRLEHTQDSMQSADYFFEGMYLQGYYSEQASKAVKNLNKAFGRQVKIIKQNVNTL